MSKIDKYFDILPRGNVIKFQIRIDDNGLIENSVSKTFGYWLAIVSLYATELINAKKLETEYK